MAVNADDQFLVNRGGTTYTQEQETLMANLETDDLLLVNRGGTSYTVTGQEFIESVLDPLVVQVTLDPTIPLINNNVSAVAIAVGGKAPDGGFVYSYEWTVADDASGTNASVEGNTTSLLYIGASKLGKFVKCVVTTTDDIGQTASGDSGYAEIETVTVAPNIASVTLTEANPGDGGRFTNSEFPFVTTMAVEPNPAATYAALSLIHI